MSTKLTFEQAVRSGKDFRCVETGMVFKREANNSYMFASSGATHCFNEVWLDQTFEIIEEKKEFTASEIETAIQQAYDEMGHFVALDDMKNGTIKKLGFK